MSQNSFNDIILPQSMKKTYKCDFSEKTLPKHFFVHKNICQDVPEHKFCSKECKTNWCSELSKKSAK